MVLRPSLAGEAPAIAAEGGCVPSYEDIRLAHISPYLEYDLDLHKDRARRPATNSILGRAVYAFGFDTGRRYPNPTCADAKDFGRVEASCVDRSAAIFDKLLARLLERAIHLVWSRGGFAGIDLGVWFAARLDLST